VVRRGGRNRWDHAPREGGDITSFRSQEQGTRDGEEKEYHTTVIK